MPIAVAAVSTSRIAIHARPSLESRSVIGVSSAYELPSAPGNVGTFDAAIVKLITDIQGVSLAHATAYALVLHTVVVVPIVILGGVVLWRSNLLGSSAKGNEYFLKHLLGTHSNVMGAENPEAPRPSEVAWPLYPPSRQNALAYTARHLITEPMGAAWVS